ncbi:hypothetical protein [Modestobacter excelsi]|nr:hypothetical protein [Modestobacter excelsi]
MAPPLQSRIAPAGAGAAVAELARSTEEVAVGSDRASALLNTVA